MLQTKKALHERAYCLITSSGSRDERLDKARLDILLTLEDALDKSLTRPLSVGLDQFFDAHVETIALTPLSVKRLSKIVYTSHLSHLIRPLTHVIIYVWTSITHHTSRDTMLLHT